MKSFIVGVITASIIAGGYFLYDRYTNETLSDDIVQSEFTALNNLGTENWKTYRSDNLGIQFQYPAEWSLENDLVSFDSECFDTVVKGNLVRVDIHLPLQGGFFIEGSNSKECANRSVGSYHYAETSSEINYKEVLKLGENDFYLDFWRVAPGTHAFHAYLFGNLRAVPSLHFYYNPASLDIKKEYTGNEDEYIKEKQVFAKVLSTLRNIE